MKIFVVFAVAIVMMSFITFGLNEIKPEPKYKMELTLNQWNEKIGILQNCQEIMRTSNYPGSVISKFQDSLGSIIKEIDKQVTPQLPKPDTTKVPPIKDSTKETKKSKK